MNGKEKAGQHSNLPCCPARYHYFLMSVRLIETTLFMLVPVRMCVVYMPFTSAPGLGLLARPPLPRRRAEQDRTLRRLFAGILRISPSTHTHTGHTLQIAYKSCIISSWRRLKSCCVGALITYVGRRRVRGLPSAAVSILLLT